MKISKIRDVKTPVRGTTGSIKANVPDGYALIAMNKSGVALKKGLLVGACVVDSDYQGEIHLHLVNVGTRDVTIVPGEKLVQFLLVPVSHCKVDVVSEEILFTAETSRGSGGFGSTGIV